MNCYNSARYLREALASVQAQTFSSWEIVFWDNRSTDESADIFKSFRDPRFHYFFAPEHTRLGIAKGRAIEQARGEWLAFLDCDDLWLPQKLEWQVALISGGGPQLGLVYGDTKILVEETARRTSMGRSALAAHRRRRNNRMLREGNIFADLLRENFILQPSAMVRRSVYQAVGGIDQSLKHAWDYDLFVKVSREFDVRAVQEIVCCYRIHGANLSHTQTADSYREAMEIVGRYLPAPEAIAGMRWHQTQLAANEILRGRILKGLQRLQMHGDFAVLLRKLMEKRPWL